MLLYSLHHASSYGSAYDLVACQACIQSLPSYSNMHDCGMKERPLALSSLTVLAMLMCFFLLKLVNLPVLLNAPLTQYANWLTE